MQPNPPYQVLLRANVIPSPLCSALFAPIPVYALNSFRPIPLSSHFAVFHPYCVLVTPLNDTMTSVFHFKLFFRSPRLVSQTRRATISTTLRGSTDRRYATTRPRSWWPRKGEFPYIRRWRWWCLSCCFESDLSDWYNGSGRLKGGQEGRVRSHVHIWHLLNLRVLFGPAGCIVLRPL